jgi:hypothetical protein
MKWLAVNGVDFVGRNAPVPFTLSGVEGPTQSPRVAS